MSAAIRWSVLCLTLLLSPFLVPAPISAPASCLVTTTSGDVQGLDVGPSCSFLGIPFAAPPTGALRWKPPQPVAPSTTTIMATTPPAACLSSMGAGPQSEDCLRMNIWVRNPLPATPAPVIVWLHTGSFVASSANFASNNGRRLAEETGVIIVAPNYRLGPFGFLAHTALAAEDPAHPVSGNYGLLDQRLALQWVRDNIASFGGDPNNVTLAGTSAGGDSTGLHLVSPGSAGLFHRAAIHSGTPTIKWPTHAEGAAQGDAFATALGCVTPGTVLTCLRGKTPAQILAALPLASQAVLEPTGNRAFWYPVVDGLELPDQPRALFETGRFQAVPTIIGTTRDEAAGPFVTRSFSTGVSLAQYDAWLVSEFGGLAPAVQAQYPSAEYPLPFDAMAQVVTDGQFICEGQRLARVMSDARAPVYVYSYDYLIDAVFPGRVIHGLETNIQFGNAYTPFQFPSHPLDATDLALHAQMAGYWTRFAAAGNPNVDDETVVHWHAFRDPFGQGRGASRHLVLDTVIKSEKRLRESACGFWEPYFLRSMLGKVPATQ